MSRKLFKDYLDTVEKQLDALTSTYVERFDAVILSSERANLKLRIRFDRRYLLAVGEALTVVDEQIFQIDYRYHFQDEKNQLIFRYDSTPHFPQLSTFPHHKHLPETVITADKPDIFSVLEEAISFIQQETSNKKNRS